MKSLIVIIGLFISINFQSPEKINTTDSRITFTFVDKEVSGSISDIESQSIIDIDELENSVLKGSVGVTTLKTGNFLRDGHLMWEKYFNRDDYPRIYFESTSIKKQNNNSYLVQGIITMKGIEKEVTLMATKSKDKVILKSTMYTSDWGVTISKERAKNQLNLKMVFKIN